jgi:hypothetical protein
MKCCGFLPSVFGCRQQFFSIALPPVRTPSNQGTRCEECGVDDVGNELESRLLPNKILSDALISASKIFVFSDFVKLDNR